MRVCFLQFFDLSTPPSIVNLHVFSKCRFSKECSNQKVAREQTFLKFLVTSVEVFPDSLFSLLVILCAGCRTITIGIHSKKARVSYINYWHITIKININWEKRGIGLYKTRVCQIASRGELELKKNLVCDPSLQFSLCLSETLCPLCNLDYFQILYVDTLEAFGEQSWLDSPIAYFTWMLVKSAASISHRWYIVGENIDPNFYPAVA